MAPSSDANNALIFQALIKEAEFIRSETLLCIDKVRQLTVYCTSIAGFALPVIASFIVAKDGGLALNSATNVFQAIEKNHLVIQFICVGICFTCIAFLRIYVGLFKQIFTFAKYFRDHLSPSINNHVGNPMTKLFFWEDWLKTNRSKKSLFIGDIDLAAEPLLMSLYIVLYGSGFVLIGHHFNSFPKTSYFLGVVVVFTIISVYLKFTNTLKTAATT